MRSLSFFLILIVMLVVSGSAATAQDATLPPTNTPRGTLPASATPSATAAPPTNTHTPTVTSSPTNTATATPTSTQTPSATPSPTASPSPTALRTPTDALEAGIPPSPTLFYPPEFTPVPQSTGIPTAMPRLLPRAVDGSGYNVINVALLGHDSESIEQASGVFRTDTMIVVSINLTTNTVSMISLPRDLLVWVSQWGMQRLNLVWGRGDAVGWTDGGWGLFRQTVLYNFGIELHYFGMIDFTGFKTIIDTIGGVDIAVDCPIQDYLWTGEYDADDQPIFELTTLPVGVHNLDGREALWYSRSRRNSTDFDRGRRQQQVLRAVWADGRDLGLITELPSLWDDLGDIVETNMPLTIMVELIPLALQIEPNEIENHFFLLDLHTKSFTTPNGDNVQVPNPDGSMITLVQNFLTPPTTNQVVTDPAAIQIFDASGNGDRWDLVAMDRLAWEGLLGTPMGDAETAQTETIIIDYTGSTKGSSLEALVAALNVNPSNVQFEPDPNRTRDFDVILGSNYSSCVGRQVQAVENLPPATPTPRPE